MDAATFYNTDAPGISIQNQRYVHEDGTHKRHLKGRTEKGGKKGVWLRPLSMRGDTLVTKRGGGGMRRFEGERYFRSSEGFGRSDRWSICRLRSSLA